MELKRKMKYETLRSAYEHAFRQFAQAAAYLHELSTLKEVELSRIAELEYKLEKAQTCYQRRRDELADYLLSTRQQNAVKQGRWLDTRELGVAYIEKLAYSLWEQEGRPNGNDQDYWFRAEASALRQRVSACA